ncbi:J domain-containing protein [Chamaesiphon minutus]|nr:J domain-containing protein [Chamaesiphon minutus]
MLLLNTEIQQVEQGDTFGEDLRLDLTIGCDDAIRGCEQRIRISRLGMTEDGKLEQVVKSLNVNIPAGTNHGSKLRLKGQGDACRYGGKPGDLYLCLLVASPAKEQKRNDVKIDPETKIPKSPSRGEDLYVDLGIEFNDALLGCVRDVEISRLEPNAKGELDRVVTSLRFTIPAGTNHGDKLRLKGQGDACRDGGEPGNLYLYLFVALQDKERKRNGVNIEAEVTITSSQASEGGEIVVNTTTG